MSMEHIEAFARLYTAAWCSQNAARVAECYEPSGSLTINGGEPSIGRQAIEAAAQDFMTAFPDLTVQMDGLEFTKNRVLYRWTLIGRNTGPGGTGNAVRISGQEEWTLSPAGLIARSEGRFDEADYERQLQQGATPAAD